MGCALSYSQAVTQPPSPWHRAAEEAETSSQQLRVPIFPYTMGLSAVALSSLQIAAASPERALTCGRARPRH